MIRPLDTRCWTIDDPSDGEWHWPRYESAVECAAQILAQHSDDKPVVPHDLLLPVIVHQPAPCWIADCDYPGCTQLYGDPEEYEGHMHATDQATLKQWMRSEQPWTFDVEGRAWCQDHSRQEIPGQLTFDDLELELA